ncbi:hypothetical protein CR513_17056, partial [Mucuna pruriens]
MYQVKDPLLLRYYHRAKVYPKRNYFMKWIKAKPLAKITTQKVQRFVWQNIICRYRIPNSVVIDNGTQFISNTLREFYENL